jgi:hypothetical protein
MSEDRVAAAVKAVRDLGVDPDSAGGAVLLAHLLQETTQPLAGSSAPRSEGTSRVSAVAEGPAGTIAEWIGVDVARVEDVFEFDGDEALLRIPSRRLARAKADRQRVLVLIKLAVERVAYERSDVPASRVNATLTDYACMDQNLAQNVTSRGDLATRRGRRGAYFYRVTQPGIQIAKDLLLNLFNTDEELRVE